MDSSILNKGNNDDFLGSSAGKNIVFVSCGVLIFVRFLLKRRMKRIARRSLAGSSFKFYWVVRGAIPSPYV